METIFAKVGLILVCALIMFVIRNIFKSKKNIKEIENEDDQDDMKQMISEIKNSVNATKNRVNETKFLLSKNEIKFALDQTIKNGGDKDEIKAIKDLLIQMDNNEIKY